MSGLMRASAVRAGGLLRSRASLSRPDRQAAAEGAAAAATAYSACARSPKPGDASNSPAAHRLEERHKILWRTRQSRAATQRHNTLLQSAPSSNRTCAVTVAAGLLSRFRWVSGRGEAARCGCCSRHTHKQDSAGVSHSQVTRTSPQSSSPHNRRDGVRSCGTMCDATAAVISRNHCT